MNLSRNVQAIVDRLIATKEVELCPEYECPYFNYINAKYFSAGKAELVDSTIDLKVETSPPNNSLLINDTVHNLLLRNSIENYNKCFIFLQKISKNRIQSNKLVESLSALINQDLKIICDEIKAYDSLNNIADRLQTIDDAINHLSMLLYSPLRTYSYSKQPHAIILESFTNFANESSDLLHQSFDFGFKTLINAMIDNQNSLDNEYINFIKLFVNIFTKEVFQTVFTAYLSEIDLATTYFDLETQEILLKIQKMRENIKNMSDKIGDDVADIINISLTNALFEEKFSFDSSQIIQEIIKFEDKNLIKIFLDITDPSNTKLNGILNKGFADLTKDILTNHLSAGIFGGIDYILPFFKSIIELGLEPTHTIMRSFKRALNESPKQIAFEFAKFCDTMIIKNPVEFSNNIELETKFFRELDSIDSFLNYYMQFLAFRLFSYKQNVPEVEKIMIKQVEEICGSNNSSKLENMVLDAEMNIELSKTRDDSSLCSFYLIKYDVWPQYQTVEIETPSFIEESFEKFKQDYLNEHKRQQLQWLKIHDIVTFSYNGKTIQCSALHYSLINKIASSELYVFEKRLDSRENSALDDLLQSNIIVKKGNGFVFAEPKTDIIVPRLQELIPVAEKEQEEYQLKQMRQTAIKAAIIRIAKQHHVIMPDDLYNETSSSFKYPVSREDFDSILERVIKLDLLGQSKDGRIQFTF